MDLILLAFLFTAVVSGYADAKESDECFRTGKALEVNAILKKFSGSKPSLGAMLCFNSIYQALFCLPAIFLLTGPAVLFSSLMLAFAAAKHLTQAYWGMCLNTGRPHPKVDRWYQKLFWGHDNVEG